MHIRSIYAGITAVVLGGVAGAASAQQHWGGAPNEPVYVTRPESAPRAAPAPRQHSQRHYEANTNPWSVPAYQHRRRPWGDVPRAGGQPGYLPGYSRGNSRAYAQSFDRAPAAYPATPRIDAAPSGPQSYARPGPGYSRDRYAYDAYPYRGSYLEDALFPWWAEYPGAGVNAPYGSDVSSPYTSWPFGGYPGGPRGFGSRDGIW